MVKKTRKTHHNRLKTKTGKKRSTKKKMNQKRKRNNTKRQRKTKRGGSLFRSARVATYEDTHTDRFHGVLMEQPESNRNNESFIEMKTQNALDLLNDDKKKVDILKVTEYGNTALHLAAENGLVEVVKRLIEINSNPGYINKKNLNNSTALYRAIHNKHTDIALALLQVPNVAILDMGRMDSNTYLHFASEKGLVEVVKRLITMNSDPGYINQVNNHDQTALHTAILNEYTDIALALLEVPNVDILKVTKSGNTALHLAAESGLVEVVKRLIEINSNSDYINKKNKHDKTSLDLAYQGSTTGRNSDKNTDIARILVENGATANTKDPKTVTQLVS